MKKKEGLIHPLRTNLYRGYTPNEFSMEPGMPPIMDINKQHAANKRIALLSRSITFLSHSVQTTQTDSIVKCDGALRTDLARETISLFII